MLLLLLACWHVTPPQTAVEQPDPQAVFDQGLALQERGELEPAAEQFELAAALAPQTVGATWNAAAARLALGQDAATEQLLRELLVREPGHVDAALLLAQVVGPPESIDVLETAWIRTGDHRVLVPWWVALAEIDADAALERAQHVLFETASPHAWVALGHLHLGLQDPAQAELCLDRARALGVVDVALLNDLGVAALPDVKVAMGWFDQAIQADGDRVEPRLNRGALALSQGDLTDAAQDFQAVRWHPTGTLGLAEVRRLQGDVDVAMGLYQTLPDHPVARWQRVQIHMARGEFPQALELADSAHRDQVLAAQAAWQADQDARVERDRALQRDVRDLQRHRDLLAEQAATASCDPEMSAQVVASVDEVLAARDPGQVADTLASIETYGQVLESIEALCAE
jgi:tetratricopeptide (TPR) repeat protein